jgi:hypothetical protein
MKGGKLNKRLRSTSRYRHLKIVMWVLLISTIPLLLVVASGTGTQEPRNTVSASVMTGDTIKYEPEYAKAHGARGLVEVGYAGSPESKAALVGNRGERVTIPIFISFVSLDSDLKSIDVVISASSRAFGETWQYWYEYDSEGVETARGGICINDLISYDRTGIVTIKAGGKVELNMLVNIPPDLPPLETNSIFLTAAGIGLLNDSEPGMCFSDSLGGEIKLDG